MQGGRNILLYLWMGAHKKVAFFNPGIWWKNVDTSIYLAEKSVRGVEISGWVPIVFFL